MYGCGDHSDKVKNFNITNPSNPCEGNEYTYKDIFDEYTVSVDWEWFECTKTMKCIHQNNRCNSHPHPDCIYEKDGLFIAEDEDNCPSRDFFYDMKFSILFLHKQD